MLGMTSLARKPPKLEQAWTGSVGDHVIDLAFSPDGAWLAAASVAGPVTVFDAVTGRLAHEFTGHGFGTSSISWHHDSMRLATGGQDGVVRIWSARVGALMTELDPGSGWTERIAFSPRGQLLATAAGRHLRFWTPDGELVRKFPDQSSTIADVAWKPAAATSSRKSELIAATSYALVSTWNCESDEPKDEYRWQGSSLALAWSPNGQYLATGDQDASVHFWITKTGSDLRMSGFETKVKELAWERTSRYLATGGGRMACVWDCSGAGPEGRQPAMLKIHEDRITSLVYQRSGSLLASGGGDSLIAIWWPEKQDRPLALGAVSAGHGVTKVCWSPDDRVLAVGGTGGEVEIFSML